MSCWVCFNNLCHIQLPFLREILEGNKREIWIRYFQKSIWTNPAQSFKIFKRIWGWQHIGLYSRIVFTKNCQASNINCHIFSGYHKGEGLGWLWVLALWQWHYPVQKIWSKKFRFRNLSMFFMVSVSVSKFFGIEKSIGIGFEIFLVLNKYESVSKQFG